MLIAAVRTRKAVWLQRKWNLVAKRVASYAYEKAAQVAAKVLQPGTIAQRQRIQKLQDTGAAGLLAAKEKVAIGRHICAIAQEIQA